MSSAVGQVVNLLGTLQNEWAGGQAFSSFDTCMAPLIRAFIEVMTEGDARARVFIFPIPTYNISRTSPGSRRTRRACSR